MDTLTENLHGAGIASAQECTPMKRPDPDAPEHVKCRWWRNDLMEITREQLAGLTGFSVSAIRDFESATKEIDPAARQRYRMACAAVAMGIQFDWLHESLRIARPITITIDSGQTKEA
jgi:hypothetical protein